MPEENSQQPEEKNQQSENMKRVQEFASKLKELGLDMNLMFDIFGGIAENVVNKSEQKLAGLIETKVKLLGDNLSSQVKGNYDTLNAQLIPVVSFVKQIQDQAQAGPGTALIQSGGDLPPGPGIGANGGGGAGALGAINSILPLLKMLGLGGSPASDSTGLSAMTTMAKSWGEVMRAMMEPVVEMQTTMRQSILSEMQTYSRTGGSLPWDREDEPAPRKAIAQLSQAKKPLLLSQGDIQRIAAEMAKKIDIG